MLLFSPLLSLSALLLLGFALTYFLGLCLSHLSVIAPLSLSVCLFHLSTCSLPLYCCVFLSVCDRCSVMVMKELVFVNKPDDCSLIFFFLHLHQLIRLGSTNESNLMGSFKG